MIMITPEGSDHRVQTSGFRPEGSDQRVIKTSGFRPECLDQRVQTREFRPESLDQWVQTREFRPECSDWRAQSQCLVCWSLTSLCHSNGHIETMPAREINPFTALTRLRSQFLRTQWSTSNHQRVDTTTHQTAQPSGLALSHNVN